MSCVDHISLMFAYAPQLRVLNSKDAVTYLSLILRVDLLDPCSVYSELSCVHVHTNALM